jgi:hypothetical protein
MQIITNNVPRDVIDYDPDSIGCIESFVMYKGEKYDLQDFQSVSGIADPNNPMREGKWDGWIADTYFSGILLKWVPGTNMEQVIMGRYYA